MSLLRRMAPSLAVTRKSRHDPSCSQYRGRYALQSNPAPRNRCARNGANNEYASCSERAANVLTAAFSPLYATVRDRVPTRVHRLDDLQQSMILDVGDSDWVRANSDVISARSTWEAVQKLVVDRGAQRQAALYTGALNAVEDAVNQRDSPRFARAIARADSISGAIETTFDQQEPRGVNSCIRSGWSIFGDTDRSSPCRERRLCGSEVV